VGEPDPGADQHREPLDQGSLHAIGASSVLVDRSGQQHRDNIDVRAPRDSVASDDAAVEVGAVQARPELLGQQARRHLGQAWYWGGTLARSASGGMSPSGSSWCIW
jgi:cell wall-associated NlpC family hydrolase